MSNNKKYLVLSIALILLTFIGVSLAYFLTSIEGENKRVTIRTSDLRIIFTNGDAIEGTEIEPGWSVTKTFSVENKTKNEYKYNIVIEELVNTFKTTGYLQYKIISTDNNTNETTYYVGMNENGCTSDSNNESYVYTQNKANFSTLSTEDIYWRIIRTTEDNGVKLLYSGNSLDTVTGYIGFETYNIIPENSSGSTEGDPMYVGYMYGTSGSLENNRTNENASIIKKYLDDWYVNNLITNYGKFVNSNTIYCNDRSLYPSDSFNAPDGFIYGNYKRLFFEKTPTYKCGGNANGGLFESTQAIADKFNSSGNNGGNGKLKCSVEGYTSENCPIALITADELVFAGGVVDSPDSTSSNPNVLWYRSNSEGNPIVGNTEKAGGWWTMSPSHWIDDAPMNVFASGDYNIVNADLFVMYSQEGEESVVRPVISLNSCVKVTGTGTPDNPYVVDYDGSCS